MGRRLHKGTDIPTTCYGVRGMRRAGRKGLCILFKSKDASANSSLRRNTAAHKGFCCGHVIITMLMYSSVRFDTEPPQFKECAKYPAADGDGFSLLTRTSVRSPTTGATAWKRCEEHSIPLKTIHIISREQAQNTPAPVTTYALFKSCRVPDSSSPTRSS